MKTVSSGATDLAAVVRADVGRLTIAMGEENPLRSRPSFDVLTEDPDRGAAKENDRGRICAVAEVGRVLPTHR